MKCPLQQNFIFHEQRRHKLFTQEAKFLFISHTLGGSKFTLCNNTEMLFPGIKILLHHYLAPDFGCDSPVSWKVQHVPVLCCALFKFRFLKTARIEMCFFLILKTSHKLFR